MLYLPKTKNFDCVGRGAGDLTSLFFSKVAIFHFAHNEINKIEVRGDSIYTKHRKSSFLSLENPKKPVESHFITAPNVKKV